MYARLLPTPERSVFLFGPRGTGKTTWIHERFPDAATYDLLDTGEALRLSKDPGVLYQELAGLPPGAWAVIDEVQKVPELLNEVLAAWSGACPAACPIRRPRRSSGPWWRPSSSTSSARS